MKPNNAIVFPVGANISEAAIEDAICMMEDNLTLGEKSYLISTTKWDMFRMADLVNRSNRDIINLNLSLQLRDDYAPGEWSLTNINTNECVWSKGS